MSNEKLLEEVFKKEVNLEIDGNILMELLQKDFSKNGINEFEQDIVILKKIYTIKIKYKLSNFYKEELKEGTMINYNLNFLNISIEPYNFEADSYCFNYSLKS